VRSGFASVGLLESSEAPGDVVDRLEEDEALDLGPVAAAELDGALGLRVDVEARERTVVSFRGGSIAVPPGRTLRVYAVDVDGTTAVVVVEAAEPVLDSLELG
jgi:hypothetical protein